MGWTDVELKCQNVRLLYGVWPLTASMEVKNNYAYVITQDICNKFIELNFLWDVWFHSQIVCCKIRLPCLLLIRCNSFLHKLYLSDCFAILIKRLINLSLMFVIRDATKWLIFPLVFGKFSSRTYAKSLVTPGPRFKSFWK